MKTNKLQTLGLLAMVSLFAVSCAKMDPKIGDKLFPDEKAGLPIAYLKTELPGNVKTADMVYLLGDQAYKDAEELSKPIEIPVLMTAPSLTDVRLKLVPTDPMPEGDAPEPIASVTKNEITIKAGETVSSEAFQITLATSERLQKVGKTTLKYRIEKVSEEDAFKVSTNLNNLSLEINYTESYEGIVEIADKIDPSWQKIDTSTWGTSYYGNHVTEHFDGKLTTGDASYFSSEFTIAKIRSEVSAVVIYSQFNEDGSVNFGTGFYDTINVVLRDANRRKTTLGTDLKYTMDITKATVNDPRPLIIRFKSPIYIHDLIIQHTNSGSYSWTDKLNIGEIEGYLIK